MVNSIHYKNILAVCLFGICSLSLYSQQDSTKNFTISGYVESYYSFDGSKPSKPNEKGSFIYNHKRHNEFDINLAFVKFSYSSLKSRSNLGFMVGSYAQFNLAAEPTWAQFIFEANAGVKLSTKHNVWLDMGILPSHIGFESAIGADCWTLTRSIAAENSPYFETGARLTYTTKNNKHTLGFNILNGWQRIRKIDGQPKMAFGGQWTYKPNDKTTINLSNYFGYEENRFYENWRLFHNFYIIHQPSEKIGITAGLDLGLRNYLTNFVKNAIWFTPQVITRFKTGHSDHLAIRAEVFSDPSGVIAFNTNSSKSLETVFGLSVNYDHPFEENFLLRGEIKQFIDDVPGNPTFGQTSTNNTSFTVALCGKF
jgi:hypothetical protein